MTGFDFDGGMAGGGFTGGYHSSQANSASSEARSASRDAQYAEERLERLTLVCMAMWSLIQDKTNLTEEDLKQRVQMLDQMDGEADGKASRGVSKCHKCDRTLSPRHQKCMYCGAERVQHSAFDGI